MFLFFFEYLSFLLHDDRDALRDGVWRDLGWGAEARHEGRVHVRFPSAVYYYTTADTYLTVATNHTREKSCWPHVRSPMQHILPTHTYAIHISQTFFFAHLESSATYDWIDHCVVCFPLCPIVCLSASPFTHHFPSSSASSLSHRAALLESIIMWHRINAYDRLGQAGL